MIKKIVRLVISKRKQAKLMIKAGRYLLKRIPQVLQQVTAKRAVRAQIQVIMIERDVFLVLSN